MSIRGGLIGYEGEKLGEFEVFSDRVEWSYPHPDHDDVLEFLNDADSRTAFRLSEENPNNPGGMISNRRYYTQMAAYLKEMDPIWFVMEL